MEAAVLESQPRTLREEPCGFRNEDLAWSCLGYDSRGLVHGRPTHVRSHQIHLSDVQACSDLKPVAE